MMIIRDITEIKRAEAQRRTLDARIQGLQKLESLGRLAGGIAHDFSNLLVGILGNASLALSQTHPESGTRDLIRQIEKAATRAADLTKQMLAYSGRGRLVVEPVRFSTLIEEMRTLLQSSVSGKAVIEYDFNQDIPPVNADVSQLQQVLLNLITNASEAVGEAGGTITIRTGVFEASGEPLPNAFPDDTLSPGPYAYIEVADTGCGMDEQTMQKVFDPFFSSKFAGRGLGLAAVLGIARGHRGAVQIESQLGQGTRCRLLIPVPEQAVEVEPPNEAPIKKSVDTGLVLVVDDEELVRSLAKNVLEAAGIEVMVADGGLEAMELFSRHHQKIDAVLLDLTMPQLSGEEVFRRMRQIQPDTHVVISSGYDEQEAVSQIGGRNLAWFLKKPYLPDTLVDKIHQAMAR